MSTLTKEHFKFVSGSECTAKDPDCPVAKAADFWADPNGNDQYRVFKNTEKALEIFGEGYFAACPQCYSHRRVDKLTN